MSLPNNPLAKTIASISETAAAASSAAAAATSQAPNAFSKANLDATINRVSGAIGAGGYNGFASGGAGALGEAATALNDIGNPVQTSISENINSLQQSVGTLADRSANVANLTNRLGIGGNLASGLSNIAGKIAKTAGQINNILSLKRGASLPSNAELFKQSGQAINIQPGSANDWRVRINANFDLFQSPLFNLLNETGGVVFPYLPTITISTKANYNQIEPIHNNYPFQAYKNSQVDEIQISGDFSAETERDAAYWIAATTFFKTATKMFFGEGANAGNPPIICNLSGYGTSIFNNVPVIIKSFSVDLQPDVNYVKCDTFGTNTWVPVSSTVNISLTPIYNRSKLRKFSLEQYARGQLSNGGVGFI